MQLITPADNPDDLQKTAARLEAHLQLAVATALRRAARSSALLHQLLSTATIEGLAKRLDCKAACVIFAAPEGKSTWHSLIPWEGLEAETPAQTATAIAFTVRENIRRWAPRAASTAKPAAK